MARRIKVFFRLGLAFWVRVGHRNGLEWTFFESLHWIVCALLTAVKRTWIPCLALMALAIGALPVHAQELKLTQKKNGKTLKVKPRKTKAGSLHFEHSGRTYIFPLEELTEDSRKEVEAWQKGKDAAIHEAIGLQIFKAGTALWEEKSGEVAKRLGWPVESSTSGCRSYRHYPESKTRFIGTRPYCCTLYGDDENMTDRLSMVFANKGDFNSMAGRGEDHFKKVVNGEKVDMTLNEAIERDIEVIKERLTLALGKPTEQRYGEKEGRRDVLRWDHRGHAFILSQRDDEYAHLLIVDEETADRQGRAKLVKDADFAGILRKNLKKSDNGDVLITNIPMVDQGPKGYCAPATFERTMRYMKVPADMYLLATLATAPGGGTNTYLLAEEATRIIRSKGRRIKELELNEDLDMTEVKRYLNKGVPILWQMASIEDYNNAVNEMNRKRLKIDDVEKWKGEVKFYTDALLPVMHNQSNHHICMIIGYNEATGEIAVSDSWGPQYELRWVPIKVAQAITTGGGFVIDL